MELDDQTLLSILEEDPERGIALLEELYTEPLRLAASQRLDNPDDVRECVHDTLTDFYLQRKLFHGTKGSLRSYLVAIADHKAIRCYWENRKQWLAAQLSQTASEDIENWEKTEQLQQALSRLSADDRRILELKYYDGYTVKEIALKMKMGHETVKKRHQRALKKLLRSMENNK